MIYFILSILITSLYIVNIHIQLSYLHCTSSTRHWTFRDSYGSSSDAEASLGTDTHTQDMKIYHPEIQLSKTFLYMHLMIRLNLF